MDFSLRHAEHGHSLIAAKFLSGAGKAFGVDEQILDEVETGIPLVQGISGQRTLDKLLQSLPVQLRLHFSFDHLSLMLRKEDGEGKMWCVLDHKDLSAFTCTESAPSEKALMSWVVDNQQAVLIPNFEEETRFSD